MTAYAVRCRAETSNEELAALLTKTRELLQTNGWIRNDSSEDYELDAPLSLNRALLIACEMSHHYYGSRSENNLRRYYALLYELTSRMSVLEGREMDERVRIFNDDDQTSEQDVFELIDWALAELA